MSLFSFLNDLFSPCASEDYGCSPGLGGAFDESSPRHGLHGSGDLFASFDPVVNVDGTPMLPGGCIDVMGKVFGDDGCHDWGSHDAFGHGACDFGSSSSTGWCSSHDPW